MILFVGKAICAKTRWLMIQYLLLFSTLFANENFSIVFVHIGKKIPNYAFVAFEQARLFNKKCPIVLIANQNAIEDAQAELNKSTVTPIVYETLKKTNEHIQFNQKSQLDRGYREGFFHLASERFFCLFDYMKQYQQEHIFHLENDITLYCDLEEIFPVFQHEYVNLIGATFDNDKRCIPGFIYFSTIEATAKLLTAFEKLIPLKYNDMQVIGICNKLFKYPVIKNLPIVSDTFIKTHPFKSSSGLATRNPENFWLCFQKFQSIFDAAAIGQFLGGVDPRNCASSPGFINESSLLNPSFFKYKWEEDSEGRRCPFAFDGSNWVKINNLHIHSKQLHLFKS